MLERIIFKDEEESNFIKLFVEIFFIFICLCFLNVLLGGNYLFLVALTSISIAYPVVKYIRRQNHLELLEDDLANSLNHFNRQIMVTWLVFVAATLAFMLTFTLLKDYSFHAKVVSSITGNITQITYSLSDILLNNLYVAFLTFLIALISTSGLLFVIIWNASILAFVLAQASTFVESFGMFFGYIGHGLLEIAGYVLIGLAASILSYRIERYKRYNKEANKHLLKQFFVLLFLGVLLILIGALAEVM
jgi:uncharacterized membrane protein SpoIIM required for sporulation